MPVDVLLPEAAGPSMAIRKMRDMKGKKPVKARYPPTPLFSYSFLFVIRSSTRSLVRNKYPA